MTDLNLTDLKALGEKATAGPWVQTGEDGYWVRTKKDGAIADVFDGERGLHNTNDARNRQTFANAAFIAAARTALPALIERVERQDMEIAKLKRANEHLRFATRPISE
jgi:hypothetical protein